MENFKKDQVPTKDGSFTIRHPVYEEEFHSKHGARFESEVLYMRVSGFYDQLQGEESHIDVLDVGLGLGYNALMTLETWFASPGTSSVAMLSLEHTEALVEAMKADDTAWKEGWSDDWKTWSSAIEKVGQNNWQTSFTHPRSGKTFRWVVSIGDGAVADLSGFAFSYIWQDAFSPKKNPELWTTDWFAKLNQYSAPQVCLVTYSVARQVRDNLEATGWAHEKIPAGGQKRQWLKARRQPTNITE